MNHHHTLAVALVVILAGCAGGTPTPDPTSTPTETATVAPTPTPTTTPTPDPFEASATFANCTAVTVNATQYEYVAVVTENQAVVEFRGDFAGERTFTTDAPIQDVTVFGSGSATFENPGYTDCVATPTPTPTATPTQTPTPTPTPTPEPRTVVKTVIITPEPTPTATPKPQPTIQDVSLLIKTTEMDRINEPAENKSEVTVFLTNFVDYPVTAELETRWYYEGDRIETQTTYVDIDADAGSGVEITYTGEHAGNLTNTDTDLVAVERNDDER